MNDNNKNSLEISLKCVKVCQQFERLSAINFTFYVCIASKNQNVTQTIIIINDYFLSTDS